MGRKKTRIPRWTALYMSFPLDKREEIDRDAESIGITSIQYVARLEERMKYRQKVGSFSFLTGKCPCCNLPDH